MKLSKSKADDESLSAGVVVVKKFSGQYKVLCLVKNNGDIDITKGFVEKDETFFQAAVRETFEESGISENNLYFSWGKSYLFYGKGAVFIAETFSTPVLSPNPVTNEFEHSDFKWLTFNQAIKCVKPYLKKSIEWARSMIIE